MKEKKMVKLRPWEIGTLNYYTKEVIDIVDIRITQDGKKLFKKYIKKAEEEYKDSKVVDRDRAYILFDSVKNNILFWRNLKIYDLRTQGFSLKEIAERTNITAANALIIVKDAKRKMPRFFKICLKSKPYY